MNYILIPEKGESRDNFIADLIQAVPDADQQLRDLADYIDSLEQGVGITSAG